MLYLCKKILFLYIVREYELESMFLLETVDKTNGPRLPREANL